MTHYATEPETRAALENRILYNMTPLVDELFDASSTGTSALSDETRFEFDLERIQNLYAPDPDAYGIKHDEGGAVLVRGRLRMRSSCRWRRPTISLSMTAGFTCMTT